MSAWLLALAAAQTPATAPPPDYFASGSEPFWGLEIRGRRITFSPSDGNPDIRATLPRRQATRNGYRLVTRGFTVIVRRERCEDEALRSHSDTVTVRTRERDYPGCGGTLLPPATLDLTDWRIVAIDAARVDGDNYVMGFGEGRIDARAGCNRLSGPYTQRGNTFTAGLIISTRMACPGPRMAYERAVARLLRGPVRISYPAGDVMVLTGSGVTVRLQRV